MSAPTPARRYARMKSPEGLTASWQITTQTSVSPVATIGLGGLFIRTEESPAVGTNVRLTIHIPKAEVKARAIVRNITPGEGMGLGIIFMSPQDRHRLSTFLKQIPA